MMALASCLALAGIAGCRKPRPVVPSKPVPAGTARFQFTKKVNGMVDLTIDGVRVPVQKTRKKARSLVIEGLAPGKHTVVLLGPLEAFAPDQIELDMPAGKGYFKVLFAQHFNSVLYGKPEEAPAAPGLPGVTAKLEP
jgi:hypothetical protein